MKTGWNKIGYLTYGISAVTCGPKVKNNNYVRFKSKYGEEDGKRCQVSKLTEIRIG